MKLFTTILLLSLSVSAKEMCEETQKTITEDVMHVVNVDVPSHLKGATITITQADGKTSTVPAEKFMVVPRKQKTIAGQNKAIVKNVSCKVSSDNKNILMAEVKKSYTGLETKTEAITGGVKAEVSSKKEMVPGLNYYRRELFDSKFGAGVGVDTEGTVKGLIGLDF